MFSFKHPLFNTFVTSPYTRKKSGYSFISITMQCFTQKSFLPYFLASEATHQSLVRSSHRRCFVRKVFLEILENSQENTCARVPFLIKLQDQPATLSKKRLWHSCFAVNFAKFIRTPSLQNTSGRLLLFSLGGNGVGQYYRLVFDQWIQKKNSKVKVENENNSHKNTIGSLEFFISSECLRYVLISLNEI